MNELSHFAINADDVPATRAFYEKVFGWRFTAFGPPDFYRIHTPAGPDAAASGRSEAESAVKQARPAAGIVGVLQKRRELVEGQPTIGFECTIAVADVDAIAAAVTAAGGTILMPRTTIAGVGHLVFLLDPGGNVVGAMEYDATAG